MHDLNVQPPEAYRPDAGPVCAPASWGDLQHAKARVRCAGIAAEGPTPGVAEVNALRRAALDKAPAASQGTGADATQVAGHHYKDMGVYQPWIVLEHWLTPEEYRGYQKGVAIAYLARERAKGGDEDIAKARHHLAKLLETLS